MSEKKTYRLNAYVNEETYRKILDVQMQERLKTKKKVSQGQVIDEVFKDL